jgi:replicative DNA helicase
MSLQAEQTLIKLLVDTDSITILAREGLHPELLPTPELREVMSWALAYRTESGKAPTVAALTDRFSEDFFRDAEIEWDEDEPVEESIEWAMTKLHSDYVRKQGQIFSRELATAISEASDEERVDALAVKAAELAAIVQTVAPRRGMADVREAGARMLEEYRITAERGGAPHGLLFGMDQIDEYTGGIRDGELAMVAAPTKVGKSFVLDFTAVTEWENERVTALFTLENSIEMTMRRLACRALHVSLDGLEKGSLDAEDTEKVEWWVHDVLTASEVPLHIINPPPSMRTPQAMMQQAISLSADSLIVDQLTFMEAVRPSSREGQPERVGRIMHDMKALISTGRHQIPCLMAHQVKRDGKSASDKTGKLQAEDMANSSEVERTVDWLFGLYQSHDQKMVHRLEWQTLAARRASTTRHFECLWELDNGRIVPGKSWDV